MTKTITAKPNKHHRAVQLVVTVLLVFSWSVDAQMVNERDPDYQVAMHQLSSAMQLINKAKASVNKAKESHHLYGYDLDTLLQYLENAEQQLNPILIPERRRQRQHQFIPDAQFINRSPYSRENNGE